MVAKLFALSSLPSGRSFFKECILSFTQKILSYSIELAGGQTINVTGLRSTCNVQVAGQPSQGVASIAIYGLPLSQMNALTVLGTEVLSVERNKIFVQAGDSHGMELIFQGWITLAYCDAQAMPQVCFRIEAHAAAFENVMKSEPTSVKGSGDVAQIAKQLAQKMGLAFENNNVNVKLSNPYLSGSYGTQIKELIEHAGVQHIIDRGKLSIWNTGGNRGASGNVISAKTGMVAYPAFVQSGIVVTSLFRTGFEMGKTIIVESDLTPANGEWTVYNVYYDLESITPHGRWFVVLQASKSSQLQQPSGDQG
jgi:hypothetical protein